MKKLLLGVATILLSMSTYAQKAFDEYLVKKDFVKFESYDEKSLPTTAANTNITIEANKSINQVRKSVFGQNAVAWQGNLNTQATREANWKNANFSLLRYPGGNWSNIFFWDGNLPTSIKYESAVKGSVNNLKSGTEAWMLETDEFPTLLDHTGADGIVCVNVGYAFYGQGSNPVNTAAEYAADWVNEYNINKKLGIKYWELGNENYGPWQAGFDLATPQKYGEACVVFANKMKAVDPSIKIGVVIYEGEGGFNNTPQAKDWNKIVLPIVQDIADFLIVHHYPHPVNNQNDISEADIYKATSVVKESIELIHTQVKTHTNKASDYFPVATTEFNARTGIRNMSRTNALFTTMMLAEYAKHGYGAVTQWDLQNGFNTTTGDHGLVASKDPFLNDGDVNPEFYPFYYMNRYFGDHVVNSSSDNSNIVTYATTFDSGELGLIVVNKGASNQVVNMDVQGYDLGARMYWHTLNGDDSDFDRTVYVNGVGPNRTFVKGKSYTSTKGNNTLTATDFEVNGVSGPQNYTTIKPYSATLPSNNVKFDAPKYSVSYIVLNGSKTDCIAPSLDSEIELCQATSVLLDATIQTPNVAYIWKKDGESISRESNITVTEAGRYTVKITSDNCPIYEDEVIVNSKLINVEGDTACTLGQTVELKVLDSGDFSWYYDPTGDNLATIGNTFSLELSTASKTFYVEDNNTEKATFGKSAMDGNAYNNTGAGVYEKDNRTVVLTVEKAFTLESLDLFVHTEGANVVLNITGDNYNKSFNFNGLSAANGGQNTLDINAKLGTGTYTLDLSGTTGGVKVQYSNAGNQELTGFGSFVVGGGNSTWYGSFYNWVISTGATCSRTPVQAVYAPNSGCVTVIETPEVNQVKLYPNPTSDVVYFSEELTFELYDSQGALLTEGQDGFVDMSTLASGVYILKTDKGIYRLMKL